ncbi:hypothetical protein CLV72_1011156 [Allonocardiopsis opalescens]|uniref:Uncharacterized protein n=1 Tax=Allonocardiopsis opalescens TaxID=1144618 RepID=A0A2T0QF41_9ACTN|nr:hypothetical protein CLV72_1011156 [Allonocardiopsis opalescens]
MAVISGRLPEVPADVGVGGWVVAVVVEGAFEVEAGGTRVHDADALQVRVVEFLTQALGHGADGRQVGQGVEDAGRAPARDGQVGDLAVGPQQRGLGLAPPGGGAQQQVPAHLGGVVLVAVQPPRRGEALGVGGVEPPSPERIMRMVRSALHTVEETWSPRSSPGCPSRYGSGSWPWWLVHRKGRGDGGRRGGGRLRGGVGAGAGEGDAGQCEPGVDVAGDPQADSGVGTPCARPASGPFHRGARNQGTTDPSVPRTPRPGHSRFNPPGRHPPAHPDLP